MGNNSSKIQIINTPIKPPSNKRVVSVTVSITMSKQFYVAVDNYKVVDKGKNEDGSYYEEIECDEDTLIQAVEEQINLPQNSGELLEFAIKHNLPHKSKMQVVDDLKDWCVDDFEVIQD